MANTLSVMIRSVVSKKRRRFTEDGYDLDLAYICPNIIAMGYPGENFQSVFRNPMNDVCHFFEFRHKEHYKVYNLRSEKAYDVNKFHGRVSVYAFEDHNPPTIELIDKFCYDVDHWLKEHPKNVAAIHCKAGKGRTGTMICCYLLYSGIKTTAEDALSYYGEKRTKNKKGVTIPSQRRYVQYYARLTRSNIKYEKRTFQLCEIRFTSAPALQNQGSVQCLISTMEQIDCTESRAYKANDSDCAGTSTKVTVKELIKFPIDFRKTFNLVLEDQLVLVTGDVKVELKKFFHFWFNSYFVCDTAVEKQGEGEDMKLIYTLPKCELDDAHKDKEHKLFREDFKVKLVLKPFKPSPPHSRNNVDGGEMPQMRQHNNHNNHVNSLMHNSLNNTNMLLTHGATSSKSGDSTIDYHNYIQHQAERSKKPISLPPFSPLASGGGIAGGSNHLQNLTQRHHQQQLQQQQQLKRSSEPTPSVYPESINRSNNIYHNNRSHHHPHQQQMQLQQQPQSQQLQSQQQPQQQQQQQQQQQSQPQPQPQQHTHHFHYQRPRVHDTQQQHQNQNQQQLQLQSQLQNNSTSSSNIHNVSSNSNSSSSSSISSQSSSSSSAGVGGGGGDGGGEEDWESGESSTTTTTTSTTTTTPTTTSYFPFKRIISSQNDDDDDNSNKNVQNDDDDDDDNDDDVISSPVSSVGITKLPTNTTTTIICSKPSNITSTTITTTLITTPTIATNDSKSKTSPNIVALVAPKITKNCPPPITLTSVLTRASGGNGTIPVTTPSIPLPMPSPSTVVNFFHRKCYETNISRDISNDKSLDAQQKCTTAGSKFLKLIHSQRFKAKAISPSMGSSPTLNSIGSGTPSAVAQNQMLKKKKAKSKKIPPSKTFQWLQNYFRTDPDFHENLSQQTTIPMGRRNSGTSISSRNHLNSIGSISGIERAGSVEKGFRVGSIDSNYIPEHCDLSDEDEDYHFVAIHGRGLHAINGSKNKSLTDNSILSEHRIAVPNKNTSIYENETGDDNENKNENSNSIAIENSQIKRKSNFTIENYSGLHRHQQHSLSLGTSPIDKTLHSIIDVEKELNSLIERERFQSDLDHSLSQSNAAALLTVKNNFRPTLLGNSNCDDKSPDVATSLGKFVSSPSNERTISIGSSNTYNSMDHLCVPYSNMLLQQNSTLEDNTIDTDAYHDHDHDHDPDPDPDHGHDHEDYYSSICDNQLSFNNSPCKSPRSLSDIIDLKPAITHRILLRQADNSSSKIKATVIAGAAAAVSSAAVANTCNAVVSSRKNAISSDGIVIAKPVESHSIGFNVGLSSTTPNTNANSNSPPQVSQASQTTERYNVNSDCYAKDGDNSNDDDNDDDDDDSDDVAMDSAALSINAKSMPNAKTKRKSPDDSILNLIIIKSESFSQPSQSSQLSQPSKSLVSTHSVIDVEGNGNGNGDAVDEIDYCPDDIRPNNPKTSGSTSSSSGYCCTSDGSQSGVSLTSSGVVDAINSSGTTFSSDACSSSSSTNVTAIVDSKKKYSLPTPEIETAEITMTPNRSSSVSSNTTHCNISF